MDQIKTTEKLSFQKRQILTRRISYGKLYGRVEFQNKEIDVVFSDPSLELNTKADWVYSKFYETNKDSGLTLEESYKILTQEKKWSDKEEKEMGVLEKDISKLNDYLRENPYNKAMQYAIKEQITKGQNRIVELWSQKNQLRNSTVEYLAEVARQKYIVQHIAQPSNLHFSLGLSSNDEWQNLLKFPYFQGVLRVYYFEESGISESQIRQLARNDPWRLYWVTSKDTGTSLFPHSAVEFTEYQYSLVVWSKIYDFAYESSNRPSDETIEDDVKFDAWYKAETSARLAEAKRNSIDKGGNGEMFIPADKEGAKEVFELNTIQAKAVLMERQKAINEKSAKGQTTKDGELPDVKREILMQYNQELAKRR